MAHPTFGLLGVLSIWLALLSSLASALSPITVKGAKLYDSDGEQFFLKGVAYVSYDDPQLDPLIDPKRCQVDAGLMKTLGANTIRVYTVDATEDHDACMQIFADQGIYVWLELTSGDNYIDGHDPDWTMGVYNNWTATIDAFAGYDNILTFSIGNQFISEDANSTKSAPYVKAATRDLKAFRKARGYRPIPISYSGTSAAPYRFRTANYLTCGDPDTAIDLYGMAVYNWCSNATYYLSGYDKIYGDFENFDVPVLFAEMGCKLDDQDRDFAGAATVLGPVFQAVFSGAIIWQWAMDDKGYGIVKYDDKVHTAFPTTLDEFNNLATVFSTATPSGPDITAYTPSNSAPACPTMDKAQSWLVEADAKLPTISGLNIDTVTARTTSSSGTGPASPAKPSPSKPVPPGAGGSSNGGGLSTGAIAGIAVGCVLGVIIIIAIAVILCIRKRKAKTRNNDEKDKAPLGGGIDEGQFKHELPAQSVGRVLPRLEMDGTQIAPQELDGRGVSGMNPAELESHGPTNQERISRRPVGGVSNG